MEASFSKLSLEENDTKISAEKDKIRHNVWSKLEKKNARAWGLASSIRSTGRSSTSIEELNPGINIVQNNIVVGG
mgnify:CR=1 FL=1